VNHAPVITYTDHFDQILTAAGNPQTVEAHGAVLILSYEVISITTAGGDPLNGLKPGVPNLVTLDVSISNIGDYIASGVIFTTTVSTNITPTTILPPWVTYTDGELRATLSRNLAPADSESFTVTLEVVPPVGGTALALPAPGYTRILEGTIGSFTSEYPPDDPRRVRDAALAGPLDIGPHHSTHAIYLPVITRNFSDWWPQSIP